MHTVGLLGDVSGTPIFILCLRHLLIETAIHRPLNADKY